MSCSKNIPTPAFRIHGHTLAIDKMIEGMTTSNLGKPYVKNMRAFSLAKDGKEEYFLMQALSTENKHGKLDVASVFLWKILNDDGNIERFMAPDDDAVPMTCDRKFNEINCPLAIEMLEGSPKVCLVSAYTTNDVAKHDSFTCSRPPSAPRYTEQSVMGFAKLKYALTVHKATPAVALFECALTTPFMDFATFNAIVKDLHADAMFVKNTPEGMSKEQLKEHDKKELARAREEARASLSAEEFKALQYKWLKRCFEVDRTSPPALFKDQIGRKTLLPTQQDRDGWDRLAPLFFMLALSKLYKDDLVSLQLALTGALSAWNCEVTPHDANYGVKPPNGNTLDWVAETPAGAIWLIEKMETHGAAQDQFIAELKAILWDCSAITNTDEERAALARKALEKLTTGISTYTFGKLGLIMAVLLKYFVGELVFPPALLYLMETECLKHDFDWYMHKPTVTFDDESEDYEPFKLIESIVERPSKKARIEEFSVGRTGSA